MNKSDIDESREGPTLEKFIQLFKLFLPGNTKTLAKLDRFSDLDVDAVNKIKNLKIKGLILDVDDTIAYNRGKILEENVWHIKHLKSKGIKIVLYSNRKKDERYDVLGDTVGILTNLPAKPDLSGFKYACSHLGMKTENIAIVGDNYITDSGAIKLGIPFIKIKPIKTTYKELCLKLEMLPYRILRGIYSFISNFYDLFREKPLTSRDLKKLADIKRKKFQPDKNAEIHL